MGEEISPGRRRSLLFRSDATHSGKQATTDLLLLQEIFVAHDIFVSYFLLASFPFIPRPFSHPSPLPTVPHPFTHRQQPTQFATLASSSPSFPNSAKSPTAIARYSLLPFATTASLLAMVLKLTPAVAVMLELESRYSLPVPDIQAASESAVVPFSTIHALSQAPFLPSYSLDDTHLISAEEFFEDNPLIAATLKPQTQQKYAVALDNYNNYQAEQNPSSLPLDHRLAIYIQHRYTQDSRPGQRQEMANLVCMLLLMFPTLRQELGLARRCIAGWKALRPAQAAAPLTKKTVLAFAWHMLNARQVASATALFLSYFGCLRVSEALGLKWTQIALPGDPRLASYPLGIAGLNVIDAKTARYSGKYQFVKLDDPDAIYFLQHLQNISHSDTSPVAGVSYQAYTGHLKDTARHFGFQNNVFTTHSARIGKATEDYLNGVCAASIAIQGRWKYLNSLRYYLNNGKAWLLRHELATGDQQKLTTATTNLTELLAQPPPAISS